VEKPLPLFFFNPLCSIALHF